MSIHQERQSKPVRKMSAENLARRAEKAAQKRAKTRMHLIRTSIDLLGNESGRYTTIDEIISRAGLARGTFYTHFETRSLLHDEICYELMHEFNESVQLSLENVRDPAIRTAFWISIYLNTVFDHRKWGWAILNASLSGPKLLGEETYNVAVQELSTGKEQGRFSIDDVAAAVDLGVGATVAAAASILRGERGRQHSSAVAALVLRSHGISKEEADEICTRPLPRISTSNLLEDVLAD